ncbi:DUF924 family protein [Oharaeibacter diazotrophicus]|uniref:Uncharacterized protein (DUF924 family) n=1 Tax=Oharaeibacter diazotrophicus TaxID=1920512 RepID=A0A4R6RDB0_9HYPH|nr:DUF924 family protein [Oharaeibacter diazotrophicus]TDP84045.1 uncharacterized protein (DUF924 family) [Oharaeibacter diazotrophicus]BBE73084.1 hypothetical protein OHA_1_02690 [Pleomorphomonas sp. SM30]GLS74873.1 hypothetical protein GCM10007904_02080 [Oharaeibacter diazotrophicus]
MIPTAAEVLSFWWDAGPAAWFSADPAFDARVAAELGRAHEEAAAGRLSAWADTPDGALALILLTDQVPRNAFRGTARAFATDPIALATARHALDAGFPRVFPPVARAFFYLPFEHAEDMGAQALSVDLFRALGDRETYFYALVHLDAIRRFGRFPHRNAVLGRVSTPEEEAYLASGGFRG